MFSLAALAAFHFIQPISAGRAEPLGELAEESREQKPAPKIESELPEPLEPRKSKDPVEMKVSEVLGEIIKTEEPAEDELSPWSFVNHTFSERPTKPRAVNLTTDERGQRTDLSISDMAHNMRVFTRPYQRYFSEVRVAMYNQERIFPIFSLYKPALDVCLLGLNAFKDQWPRVTEKLSFFDVEDDLTLFQELAVAHEVGHCMAAKFIEGMNRKWTASDREFFADVFALLHVEEFLPERRDEAFSQLVRFRAAEPVDRDRPDSTLLVRIFNLTQRLWPHDIGNRDIAMQRVELTLRLMELSTRPEGVSPPKSPSEDAQEVLQRESE